MFLRSRYRKSAELSRSGSTAGEELALASERKILPRHRSDGQNSFSRLVHRTFRPPDPTPASRLPSGISKPFAEETANLRLPCLLSLAGCRSPLFPRVAQRINA